MHNLDKDFARLFPRLDYKLKKFQKDVIGNVVDKDNTLCIMPTGGGKSTIYWMSAAELGGIAIVVSPLTALIAEQAEKVKEQGYEAIVLHSGISPAKQRSLMTDLAKGIITPQFIFAGPEKIATDGYFEFCLKQRNDDIKLIVVDEVHCVSQWGMSFRPFYKRIPDFLNRLFGNDAWCRVLALTATLNPIELKDICDAFRINKNNILKQTVLMRTEIQLHVLKFSNEDEKEERFWEILKMHRDEKVLVYLYRKEGNRSVEDLCEKASGLGYKSSIFHGDLSPEERMKIIDNYRANKINVIFATNAFGMGIDIPDIRVVIHFMMPESAEQYYQEIGRAARDGKSANAYLLYSNKNIDIKRSYFIDKSFPTEAKLRDTYKIIGKKKGYRTFDYFDNDDIQECLPYFVNCGLIRLVCKGFSGLSELYDITDPEIEALYKSTPSHAFVRTVIKNNLEPDVLSQKIYASVLSGKAKLNKPLERWLVIDVDSTEISDNRMHKMLKEIADNKKYKHDLLDYFVYLIEDNRDSSQHLHQEIASYLGMDKYQLNRIYKTVDGNLVRSKSEVIICNLLAKAGIDYEYERLLEYEPGKVINPDFTIYLPNGTTVFWEHVGMLGNEEYDANWSHKMDVYEKYYPGRLYKTYESGSISTDAESIIGELKKAE